MSDWLEIIDPHDLHCCKFKEIYEKLSDEHKNNITKIMDDIFSQYDINLLFENIKDDLLFETVYGFRRNEKLFKLLIDKKYDDFISLTHQIYNVINMKKNEHIFEDDQKELFNKTILTLNYDFYKLGNILNFEHHSKQYIKKSENGKYNLYSDNYNIDKCDKFEYKNENLIFNCGFKPNIWIDKKFSVSNNYIVAMIKNKKVDIKYVYYYIYFNIDILLDEHAELIEKMVSKKFIANIDIPIPTFAEQQTLLKMIYEIEKQKNEYIFDMHNKFKNLNIISENLSGL